MMMIGGNRAPLKGHHTLERPYESETNFVIVVEKDDDNW